MLRRWLDWHPPLPKPETIPSPLRSDAIDEIRALEAETEQDLLGSVIDAYLTSSEVLERSLVDASRAGDAARLARAAHTLKSSSAQVGAEQLSGFCKEIEGIARGDSLAGIPALVDAVVAELERVREALAAERLGAHHA